jgi:acyl carrier protein
MTELITLASGEHCTEDELRASVRAVVLEIAPNSEGAQAEGLTDLVDHLEFNSLALLELAFTLEDEHDLMPIDEETARGMHTVEDIQDHIVRELRQRSERAAVTLDR